MFKLLLECIPNVGSKRKIKNIYKCAKAMSLAFVLLDLCVRQPNDAKI